MRKPPLPTLSPDFARDSRASQADQEGKLRRSLRGSRLDGLTFRRQPPIPPYVADFCCDTSARVAGPDGSHSDEADAARTRSPTPESQRLTVSRFRTPMRWFEQKR